MHLTLDGVMVNDADGVINVKLTVKIVNYEVNRQNLVKHFSSHEMVKG